MKFLKKCIVMLLVVCVLVSACACQNLTDIITMPDGPHMSERVYEKIDEEAAYALIAEIEDLCQSEENLELVVEKREQFFVDFYNKLSTMNTIASINFDKNVSNEYWQAESVWIENLYQQLHNDTLELEKVIFTSPCADYFIEELGQDYADMILESESLSDEQLELLATVSELEATYMTMLNEGGSDQEFANILKEMVINRNAYARTITNGEGEYYDNYMEYAYENVFGRDYGPEEGAEFREALKTYVEPLAVAAGRALSTSDRGKYLASGNITSDKLKEYMPLIIEATVPEMMTSWNYMMDKGLYDFTTSTKKANSSYVTEFRDYGDAFMFLNTSRDFNSDLSTAIHEFGHYNEVFMSREYLADDNAGMSYDLAETHSQALELITLPAVKGICNKYYFSNRDLFIGYSFNLFYNSYWAMLSGAFVDAFEYEIYTADESELNLNFFKDTMKYCVNYYWPAGGNYNFYDIPHVFASPAYYISYAVSMVFSYVVWASDAPVENYLKVVKYGTNNYLSTVCKATRLDYPLDPLAIENISVAISNFTSQTFGW